MCIKILSFLLFLLTIFNHMKKSCCQDNGTGADSKINHGNESLHSKQMQDRINYLYNNAKQSVLVHVHIPKAGGTALSAALSSDCKCVSSRTPPNCGNCKTVHGSNERYIPYNICRSTGWRVGVHPPYSTMKYMLTHSAQYKDVIPVYIIMLRRPFDRFVSEMLNWGGSKGKSVDWSVHKKIFRQTIYLPEVDGSLLPDSGDKTPQQKAALKPKNDDLPTYVKMLANLSHDLIYQDRQTKMIGGTVDSFNMRIYNNDQVNIGSRWNPPSNHMKSRILERAHSILAMKTDVIIGLEERFAETICTLEIVYGHLYSFKWDSNHNSHNKDLKIDLTTRLKTKAEMYPDVYKVWKEKNIADEKLYASTEILFEEQFQAALLFLHSRLNGSSSRGSSSRGSSSNGGSSEKENILRQVPHCRKFL